MEKILTRVSYLSNAIQPIGWPTAPPNEYFRQLVTMRMTMTAHKLITTDQKIICFPSDDGDYYLTRE